MERGSFRWRVPVDTNAGLAQGLICVKNRFSEGPTQAEGPSIYRSRFAMSTPGGMLAPWLLLGEATIQRAGVDRKVPRPVSL